MGLKRTVEPVADAITINTAKKACEIGTDDTTHDIMLHRCLLAAIRDVERVTRRALITQTWKLTMRHFPMWDFYLPRPPLQSVSSIQYVDTAGATQTLSSSLYQVSTTESPGVVQPAYNEVWPETQPLTLDAVSVTFVAGYGDDSTQIPEELATLVAELTAFRFMNRGDVEMDIPKHIKWSLNSLHCGAAYGLYGVSQ